MESQDLLFKSPLGQLQLPVLGAELLNETFLAPQFSPKERCHPLGISALEISNGQWLLRY